MTATINISYTIVYRFDCPIISWISPRKKICITSMLHGWKGKPCPLLFFFCFFLKAWILIVGFGSYFQTTQILPQLFPVTSEMKFFDTTFNEFQPQTFVIKSSISGSARAKVADVIRFLDPLLHKDHKACMCIQFNVFQSTRFTRIISSLSLCF